MYLYGWELGIIEAICATLSAGFAVDYTIHFAIAYVERTPEKDGLYNLGSTRQDRVLHAFFELGPPVLSGAITTCGAAIFLWNCQSSFFQIFGTFLCTVVTWSVLYAHFFFMPLLSLAGPDHGKVTANMDTTATVDVKEVGAKSSDEVHEDDENEAVI
jgi:predicted RND superfamily exporter protein